MVNLKTINGEKKTKGMVSLKIKILNIEKIMDIYVIDNENFKYDFLIGLDCIKNFKLIQNEELKITQCDNQKEPEITSISGAPNINVEIPDELGDKNKRELLLYSKAGMSN